MWNRIKNILFPTPVTASAQTAVTEEIPVLDETTTGAMLIETTAHLYHEEVYDEEPDFDVDGFKDYGDWFDNRAAARLEPVC